MWMVRCRFIRIARCCPQILKEGPSSWGVRLTSPIVSRLPNQRPAPGGLKQVWPFPMNVTEERRWTPRRSKEPAKVLCGRIAAGCAPHHRRMSSTLYVTPRSKLFLIRIQAQFHSADMGAPNCLYATIGCVRTASFGAPNYRKNPGCHGHHRPKTQATSRSISPHETCP